MTVSNVLSDPNAGHRILERVALSQRDVLDRALLLCQDRSISFSNLVDWTVEQAFPNQSTSLDRVTFYHYCRTAGKAGGRTEIERVHALASIFKEVLPEPKTTQPVSSDPIHYNMVRNRYDLRAFTHQYFVNCIAATETKHFFGTINSLGMYDIAKDEYQLFPTENDVTKIVIEKGLVFHNGDEGICTMRSGETGEVLRLFKGHEGQVTCIKVYGDMLVTGGKDGTVRVWNLHTGECERVIQVGGTIDGLDVSSGVIVTLSRTNDNNDAILAGWGLSGTSLYQLKRHPHLSTFRINKDRIFVTGSISEPRCQMIDLKTGKVLARLEDSHGEGSSNCIHFSEDLVIIGTFKKCVLWNLKTDEKWALDAHEGHINSIDLDGKTLVLGSEDGTCSVWNLDTRGRIATFSDHNTSYAMGISQVIFSQNKLTSCSWSEIIVRDFSSETKVVDPKERVKGLIAALEGSDRAALGEALDGFRQVPTSMKMRIYKLCCLHFELMNPQPDVVKHSFSMYRTQIIDQWKHVLTSWFSHIEYHPPEVEGASCLRRTLLNVLKDVLEDPEIKI